MPFISFYAASIINAALGTDPGHAYNVNIVPRSLFQSRHLVSLGIYCIVNVTVKACLKLQRQVFKN